MCFGPQPAFFVRWSLLPPDYLYLAKYYQYSLEPPKSTGLIPSRARSVPRAVLGI